MQPKPGLMFAQCRLVEQIGAGGMGVVWKALDTSLNRHVAIKILPSDLTTDGEWRQRFQREAEAVAALDHPNIAVIHQVGEQDGTPFIVMQLLEGQTLRQIMREGPVPLKQWLKIAAGLADGLAHAHQQGIIHRDLKPDNVMVTEGQRVKILDFGLAKVIGDARAAEHSPARLSGRGPSGDANLTRVGQTFGTLSYMSPEQARGEAMDARSDLFSMGVLLYEMAAGQVPFKGSSEEDTLGAIVGGAPPPFPPSATALPADAERVMYKALEKEPERRYQHADEMATDLRNLQRDLTSGRITPYSGMATARRSGAAGTTGAARGRRWPVLALAGLAVVLIAAAVTGYLQIGRPGETQSTPAAAADSPAPTPAPGERKMIVVLPFENLGPPEDAYFAAGITEEITSRLAAVAGLGVISRNSAFHYAGTGKTTQEIGEELGVGYVLSGTVRWARQEGQASRVRITPQLIRVSDDTHLWSEAYDEVMDDIFEIQSEIATRVIEAAGVALLDTHREALEFRPTENMVAYRAYVRGMDSFRQPDNNWESFQFQIEMFEKAIELDPGFALAHAWLSRAHAGLYHFGLDRTPERLERARLEMDRALELAPDLPEIHLARGIYEYWCHKDYPAALAALTTAQEGMPSSAEPTEWVGFIRRRQGRWDEATADLEASFKLNPLDSRLAEEIGLTHMYTRRYEAAQRFLNQSIALAPEQSDAYLWLAEISWLWHGATQATHDVLETMPATDFPLATEHRFLADLFAGNLDAAIQLLEQYPEPILRHYRFVRPKSLLLAEALTLRGEPERAAEAFTSARDSMQQEVLQHPEDYRGHSALGLALAGLGHGEEAVREGLAAVELYPLSRDAFFGIFPKVDLALIYTMVGQQDDALREFDELLSIPSTVSVRLLQNDPRLAALREHSGFAAMAARHAADTVTP